MPAQLFLFPAQGLGENLSELSCVASMEAKQGARSPNPAGSVSCVSPDSRTLPAWQVGSRSHLSWAEELQAAGRMLHVT